MRKLTYYQQQYLKHNQDKQYEILCLYAEVMETISYNLELDDRN